MAEHAGEGWRVKAPARLHLGFLDLNGDLGRRFGSLGLTLDRPSLELAVAPSAALEVSGGDTERLRGYVEAAAAHLGVPARGRFSLKTTMPAHAGFGSGTQLALATAAGLARLHNLRFSAKDAAAALDRGNRSGIGLAAFIGGGLVLDGGRGTDDASPPLVARLPFPAAWRIVLVLEARGEGVHGAAEKAAFATLPPFPAAVAAALCRLTLMKILPAVADADIDAFGSGVTELQRCIGNYFAPAQGGPFTSRRVAAALTELTAAGAAGIGQSSWGPTGYAFARSGAEARRLIAALSPSLRTSDDLAFVVARGRNSGARISPARTPRSKGQAAP